MAEIGSLSVSLSMDSSNFNGSLSQVDRNLRAMGSELKAVKNLGSDYGKSLDGLKSKKDILSRSVEAANIKLAETRKKYDEMVASGTANEIQLERQAKKVNDAQAQYNRLKTELDEVDKALKTQSSSWYQLSEKLEPIGKKLKSVGDGMKDIGKDLSMKVTAPIVALGTGAFKAAVDFESAFAGVRKTVDATEEEFKQLEKGIRDMSKEIPAAATEIAGVAEAAGQLGIKKEAIMGFTRTMVDLGVATNMTSDQAATSLARLANITQMNQKDFDKLGSAIVALGNNFATTESEITEMGLRLAGAGAQVGMSEADILGLAAALTSVGIQAEMGGSAFSRVMVNMQMAVSGTDKFNKVAEATGLTLRELQLASGSGGKAFGMFAESLGLTRKELNDIISTQSDLENFAKIAGMSADEFKKAFADDAVSAIGAFVNGLGHAEEAGTTAINMLQEMGISEIQLRDALLRAGGASELFGDAVKTSNEAWNENNALTKEAAERYKTTASQIKIMWNEVKDLGIEIGGVLVPIIKDGIETVKPWIRTFSEADDSTKKLVVAVGALAAAAGPLLVVGGSIMSGVGGIVTTVSTLSGALAAAGGASAVFGGALTVLTGPIGLTIATLAALGIGAYAVSKELKKPAIEVEIFSDKVSESTKKAVSAYLDLDEQATIALNQLLWSQQNVTQEMANGIIDTFGKMGDQVLEEMKKDHEEQLKTTQELFAKNSALTEEEEAKILESVIKSQQEQQDAISEGQVRIAEILNTAKEEKRAITDAEKREINAIQQELKTTAVKIMSESEAEQRAIFESLKAESSKITADQAAQVVKNSKKQKDEVVKEANEQYNKSIAEIIRMRDEAGVITAEQANKLIQEAKRQRDDTVKNAEDMHKNVVDQAKLQADEHVNKVNWETGEVLSKWQAFKKETANNWNEMLTNTKNNWNQMGNDIKQRAEEMKSNAINKFEELKNNARTKFQEIKENILRPIDEAKDTVFGIIDRIKSTFSNMRIEIPKPKLPHIDVDWKSFGIGDAKVKVPSFNIDWYAKGALFTKPTIFNTPYGLKGFGEAGPEAALPLTDKVLGKIGEMIAERMPNSGEQTIIVPVYLDSYEIARATYPHMDNMQGNSISANNRYNGVR